MDYFFVVVVKSKKPYFGVFWASSPKRDFFPKIQLRQLFLRHPNFRKVFRKSPMSLFGKRIYLPTYRHTNTLRYWLVKSLGPFLAKGRHPKIIKLLFSLKRLHLCFDCFHHIFTKEVECSALNRIKKIVVTISIDLHRGEPLIRCNINFLRFCMHFN